MLRFIRLVPLLLVALAGTADAQPRPFATRVPSALWILGGSAPPADCVPTAFGGTSTGTGTTGVNPVKTCQWIDNTGGSYTIKWYNGLNNTNTTLNGGGGGGSANPITLTMNAPMLCDGSPSCLTDGNRTISIALGGITGPLLANATIPNSKLVSLGQLPFAAANGFVAGTATLGTPYSLDLQFSGDLTGHPNSAVVTGAYGLPYDSAMASAGVGQDGFSMTFDATAHKLVLRNVAGGGSSGVTTVAVTNGLSISQAAPSPLISLRLNLAGGLASNLGIGANELGIAPASVTSAMLFGGITNAKLQNPQTTINTAGLLVGGGVAALGGSLTITCPTCLGSGQIGSVVQGWSASLDAIKNLSGVGFLAQTAPGIFVERTFTTGPGLNIINPDGVLAASQFLNTGVLAVLGGLGIQIDNNAQTITVTNTGVRSLIGTLGIGVSAANGDVTLTNNGLLSCTPGGGILCTVVNGVMTLSSLVGGGATGTVGNMVIVKVQAQTYSATAPLANQTYFSDGAGNMTPSYVTRVQNVLYDTTAPTVVGQRYAWDGSKMALANACGPTIVGPDYSAGVTYGAGDTTRYPATVGGFFWSKVGSNIGHTPDPHADTAFWMPYAPNVTDVPGGGTGAATLTGIVHGNGAAAMTAGPVVLTSEVSGFLSVGNGGTGKVADLFTAKGDMWIYDGTKLLRVPIGSDGQLWTADSTQAGGAKWATFAGGGGAGTTSFLHTAGAGLSGSTFNGSAPITWTLDLTANNTFTGNNTWNGTSTFGKPLTIATAVTSSGAQVGLTVTQSADTAQTAGAAKFLADFQGAAIQWATGALHADQAQVHIGTATYSAVAASVMDNGYNLIVDSAPTAGSNMTITNRGSIWVKGFAEFDGGLTFATGTTVKSGTATLIAANSLVGTHIVVAGQAAGGVYYADTTTSSNVTAAGTANQLFHGGAAPSWSAVNLASADVTGLLPAASVNGTAVITTDTRLPPAPSAAGKFLYDTGAAIAAGPACGANTVPHGAGAAVYTCSKVDQTADITGNTPIGNGGTNSSTALTGNRLMTSNSGATAIVEGNNYDYIIAEQTSTTTGGAAVDVVLTIPAARGSNAASAKSFLVTDVLFRVTQAPAGGGSVNIRCGLSAGGQEIVKTISATTLDQEVGGLAAHQGTCYDSTQENNCRIPAASTVTCRIEAPVGTVSTALKGVWTFSGKQR